MTPINSVTSFRRTCAALLTMIMLISSLVSPASAHPLGQYTINHFARIESGLDRVRIRYVVDLAELATFQELQSADVDSSGSLSDAERVIGPPGRGIRSLNRQPVFPIGGSGAIVRQGQERTQ